MGSIVSYAFYAGLLLAVFYLVYKWTLASATFFRFNRFVLIAGYAVSLLALPVCNALTGRFDDNGREMQFTDIMAEISSVTDTPAPQWPEIVISIYALGVLVSAIFTLREACRIRRIVRTGIHIPDDSFTIVTTDCQCSPFSWGRYIVLPSSGAEDDRQMIIEHERCHLRHLHWLELALAQIVVIFNWFNPAAYLLVKELQDVHEFEVDKDILSKGYDEKRYQMMLLRNTASLSFHNFVDGLTCSRLKTRLRMMMTEKSRPSRRLFAVITLPAIAMAVVGVRNSALAEPLAMIDSATIIPYEVHEVNYSVRYLNDGSQSHTVYYGTGENMTSIKMDIPKNTHDPKIYVDGHLSSRNVLGRLRADEIDFIIGDTKSNRFVIKTK